MDAKKIRADLQKKLQGGRLSRLEEVRAVTEAMRALDPKGFGEAEKVVRRNVRRAALAGAFGKAGKRYAAKQ
ncbi:Uncharacterised protein [Burkholderia pseudomallei]|uniref:hypothetical protein n=1 Tax=Burkholderia pseudomallei TaxID=28450 RepID=UPI0005DEF4DB|nr:hypothetical protein [Burkholderia pseudomallei]CAK1277381.1 Uncharacterised protein [Burkholderia pseudomallei]